MLAIGAMACDHSMSRASSVAQPDVSLGETRAPVLIEFDEAGRVGETARHVEIVQIAGGKTGSRAVDKGRIVISVDHVEWSGRAIADDAPQVDRSDSVRRPDLCRNIAIAHRRGVGDRGGLRAVWKSGWTGETNGASAEWLDDQVIVTTGWRSAGSAVPTLRAVGAEARPGARPCRSPPPSYLTSAANRISRKPLQDPPRHGKLKLQTRPARSSLAAFTV